MFRSSNLLDNLNFFFFKNGSAVYINSTLFILMSECLAALQIKCHSRGQPQLGSPNIIIVARNIFMTD